MNIYNMIEESIDTFPVYEIDGISFTIYAVSCDKNIITDEESITFILHASIHIDNIHKKHIIKATNKIKHFLVNHFDKLIAYKESWGEDGITFNVEYIGDKKEQ